MERERKRERWRDRKRERKPDLYFTHTKNQLQVNFRSQWEKKKKKH